MPRLAFIQFYPNDWLAEPSIRTCSLAARGLWIDMLSLMHLSPRRGYLLSATGNPLPLEQLARLTGCPTDEVSRLIAELRSSGSFNCTDDGTIFSRRMVKDEAKRQACSEAGKRGGGNPTFNGRHKGSSKGDGKGLSLPPEARGQNPEAIPPPPTPAPEAGGKKFQEFYAAFPKQTNPEEARKAFAELAPDDSLFGEIMAALKVQSEWPEATENAAQRFRPPHRWLRNKGWTDARPKAGAKPKTQADRLRELAKETAK